MSLEKGFLAANVAAARRRRNPPALPSLEGGREAPLPPVPPDVLERLRSLASQGEPFLLSPMGSPELVLAALAARPAVFLTMRPAIFVVEPDEARFRDFCRSADLSAALEDDAVLWFVGEDWEHRLASFLRANPGIPVPRLQALLGGGLDPGPVLEEALAWRHAEAARLEREAARACAEPRRTGPTRILLVTSRFTTVLQYAVRDLAEAFRSLGCEAQVAIERRDCEWSVMFEVRQRILSFRPDLAVQLDHLRPEFGTVFPEALPYACWVQDRLPNLFESRWIERLGPKDLTFSMWPAMTRDLKAAGHPQVLPLPVAGNALLYAPVERRPICDVAFVSNLAVPKAPPGLEDAEGILRREGIGYRQESFYLRLLDRLKVRPTPALLHWLSFDLERWVQRTEPLRWARGMGLDVRVWGRGWAESPEFSPVAQGVAAPGEALRDLYASARIHLQMNSDTNVHARVFECLLSGGFPMAWAHPTDGEEGGLGSMLEVGREVVTFSGRADFEAKAERYLADEAARKAVSAAGRARTLKEHTTAHRAAEILRRTGLAG